MFLTREKNTEVLRSTPSVQQVLKQEKLEKPQNEVQATARQLGRLTGFQSISLFFGPWD